MNYQRVLNVQNTKTKQIKGSFSQRLEWNQPLKHDVVMLSVQLPEIPLARLFVNGRQGFQIAVFYDKIRLYKRVGHTNFSWLKLQLGSLTLLIYSFFCDKESSMKRALHKTKPHAVCEIAPWNGGQCMACSKTHSSAPRDTWLRAAGELHFMLWISYN
jgi:hypothetical protein